MQEVRWHGNVEGPAARGGVCASAAAPLYPVSFPLMSWKGETYCITQIRHDIKKVLTVCLISNCFFVIHPSSMVVMFVKNGPSPLCQSSSLLLLLHHTRPFYHLFTGLFFLHSPFDLLLLCSVIFPPCTLIFFYSFLCTLPCHPILSSPPLL